MYYTHHFAHHATLRRACEWLGRLGVHAEPAQDLAEDTTRLSLVIERGRLAEVELLINAIERTDPEGWPSFWDDARAPHAALTPTASEEHPRTAAHRPEPIGWHPIDTPLLPGLEFDRLREAMGH